MAQSSFSEIEVLGVRGAPRSIYEFKESPSNALDVIDRLASAIEVGISSDERALFADAADGELNDWSLAEAALLASGVVDTEARRAYMERVSELQADVDVQLSIVNGNFARGQALLRWLHADVMQTGYVLEQTDLSTLLDSGTYNCVSSAVMFSILANGAGLDVRGIEVPDHAFAIVYDGSNHADVETTTDAGFNPARAQASAAAFQERTGFAYIPDSRPDQRRETTALGLAALIYYNHGVEHSRSGRHFDALVAYFRALSLDPDASSAVKNALSSLANWSSSLAQQASYDRALEVLEVGLALAPQDRTLLHNRHAVWQNKINDALETASVDEAFSVLAAAHTAVPDAGFDRQQTSIFVSRGEAFADNQEWSAALEVATSGQGRVNEASKNELDRYVTNLVLRWSSGEMEALRWSGALDALTIGLKINPRERRFQGNVAYVLQEWSAAELRAFGADAADTVIAEVLSRFPDLRDVQQVARSFAIRRIQELRDVEQYSDALTAVERYASVIGSDRDTDTLIRGIFDAQANIHVEAQAWEQAIDVYSRARTAFPDNAQIKQNEVATWHSWAQAGMDAGDWNSAINVYEKAIAANPEERGFAQNVAYLVQEWLAASPGAAHTDVLARVLLIRFAGLREIAEVVGNYYMSAVDALHQRGEFETAAQLAGTGSEVLGDHPGAKKVVRYAYDRWAGYHAEGQEWQQAVDVYDAALAVLPDDSHLRRNAAATWHARAKPLLDSGSWEEAIEVYELGLQSLPGTSSFEQNIRYCRQQMSLAD